MLLGGESALTLLKASKSPPGMHTPPIRQGGWNYRLSSRFTDVCDGAAQDLIVVVDTSGRRIVDGSRINVSEYEPHELASPTTVEDYTFSFVVHRFPSGAVLFVYLPA